MVYISIDYAQVFKNPNKFLFIINFHNKFMAETKEKQKIRVQNISCVIPETSTLGGLFLGNIYGAQSSEILHQYGIRSVLTSSLETPNYSPAAIPFHLAIKAKDEESYTITNDLQQCFDFIDKTRAYTNVYVHCYAGVSRSVTIVIAYLMKKFRWGLEEAYNFVKEKRVVAKPNDGFMKQLKQFDNRLKMAMVSSPSNISRINYFHAHSAELQNRGSFSQEYRLPSHSNNPHGQMNALRERISRQSNIIYGAKPQVQPYKNNLMNTLNHNNSFSQKKYSTELHKYPHNNSTDQEQKNVLKHPRKHSQIPIPTILKRLTTGQKPESIKDQISQTSRIKNIYTSSQQHNMYKTSPFNNNNHQKSQQAKTTSRIIRPKDLPGYKNKF